MTRDISRTGKESVDSAALRRGVGQRSRRIHQPTAIETRLILALMLLGLVSCRSSVVQKPQTLHTPVVEESLTPIRPGVPGRAPFWNEHAKQFIWAPAFDFKPVESTRAYRFVVKSESGQTHTF